MFYEILTIKNACGTILASPKLTGGVSILNCMGIIAESVEFVKLFSEEAISMHKKQKQALATQVATHDIFGQFCYFKNDNGEIWFVGVDIAKILGYKNCSRDLRRHVEPEDMKVVKLSTETVENFGGLSTETVGNFRGNPNKVIINESGLYALIFGSKLPQAKKFKRWVTSEVLPSIRKTSSYSVEKKKSKKFRLLMP